MEKEKIESEYKSFQDENQGFGNFAILTKEGKIIFLTEKSFMTEEEAINCMDAWLNKKSAVVLGENRFPILNWEEFQFAARNVKGKGALVGSAVKSKNYVIAHLSGRGLAPTMAAIKLNRWAWDLF